MSVSEKVRLLAESYAALDEEERSEFATLVVPNVGEFGAEWLGAIRSRADDIDAGRVELVAGDDFLRRLRAI